MMLAQAGGSSLASWTEMWLLLGAFGGVVVALVVAGRGRSRDPLLRIPAGLERLTGIPGWAAAMVGLSWFGLLMAGIGFYNDVAWHVGLGRDEELFTAPHTMIVVGLALIALSAAVGIAVATLSRADVGLRWGALRVPWSAIPMGLLGLAALSGFPLDELWHRQYGIDVTMWSPTHLLMILGASLSPIAGWLALGEARVDPRQSVMARVVHVAVAWLVLAGLSSVQGEFEFGVPQFQQLYHPVLIALAGGFALVAARVVLGPGWTLLIGALSLVIRTGDASGSGVPTRPAALYVGAAVAVELVALLLGTTRRARFAVVCGLAVATLGLATEWVWNADAHQRWTSALLPDAVIVGALAAVGAAVLGAGLGSAVARRGRQLPATVLALAGVAALVALTLPLPRRVGDVRADLTLDRVGDRATVEVTLDPVDAAEGARWFQAIAWQGGGLRLADMEEVAPGRYRSERPVPVSGDWKTLLRLHRGAEMMAVPIWLPADAEIDEPEVPAVDRRVDFAKETGFLLREQEDGDDWFAWVVYVLLAGVAVTWASAFALAAARTGRLPAPRLEVSS